MSLRGFFSRKPDSQRRKKAWSSTAMAVRGEDLEDRVLLSVESPLLTDHGVTFENINVLDRVDLTFFSVDNPLYSNNNGLTPGRGNGDGLRVDIDPTTPNGQVAAQLRNITYQGLIFNNNSNAGSSLNLSNIVLDTVVIDSSTFTNNGRAGLVINLTNAQIGSLIIRNSTFTGNANDGICILGTNSNVNNIVLEGNNINNNSPNALNDGALIRFTNSRLGFVNINTSNFIGNGANGLNLDLNNTPLGVLSVDRNQFNGNAIRGNGSGLFLDFQDSEARGNITDNTFNNNTFTPTPTNPNLTQGDGLRILMSRSLLPNGTRAPGLRNLSLDNIRDNIFDSNGGAGLSANLGENTTFNSTIAGNTITSNRRAGIDVFAKDTANAFDLQIGGDTLDLNNNNIDSNLIDSNRGAGIVVTLDDTSNVVGNTSGRLQILSNTITNTVDDNLLSTEFAGEGLFVRARGTLALVNGAARLLNSQIDGNVISGNASHGIAFDISEDSEVVDLLIGDVFDPSDPRENFEGDGFFFQNQFFRNSGNRVEGNGGNGINFLRRDSASVRDVRIIDNLFNLNVGVGVNYITRNNDNVVNTLIFQHNDVTNNLLGGVILTTQVDAILLADLDNNLISGNGGDGILTLGFENDATDGESIGGTWTRNIIQNNQGIGININGVPGALSPLVIGRMGTDDRGNSLGNLIDSNGNDGVEINAPGFIDLVNNTIIANGQNNLALNPHGDGKGIDINLNDVDPTLPNNGILTTGVLNVFLGFNNIEGNFGDGIEIISRSDESVLTLVEVLAYGNIIDENLGRGVDVLNAGRSDTHLVFGDGVRGNNTNANIIRSNGLEGFYAVNTTSTSQAQNVDATVAMAADTDLSGIQRFRAPNLTLDINGNEIQANGLPANALRQLNGSGLVVRVGTSGSVAGGTFTASIIPDREGIGLNVDTIGVGASNSATLGNGRVNARVNNNLFGGNLGVDVITRSFTSTQNPPTTTGTWDAMNYTITNGSYRSDPLARLNLEFTNNFGNSVDLVDVGAFYDDSDGAFKSRLTTATPGGAFFNSPARRRNAQRLPDRTSDFGAPTFGPGGLGSFTGTGGDITSILPGSPGVPILVSTADRSGFITNATNAMPIVITSQNHGLGTGEFVEISGIFGNTAANGIFQVNVLSANTFELLDPLTGMPTMGNGNYLGGGTWVVRTQGSIDNLTGAGVSPIVISDFSFNFPNFGHGLTTGDTVTVLGVQGNTNANGTFTVTVIDAFRFSLDGTTGNGAWVPGTGTYFKPSPGHGLQDGDEVAIQLPFLFFDPNLTPGFSIDGTYEIVVNDSNSFFLVGTEGETNVPATLPFGTTYLEASTNALKYPGVGSSTFRIVESGNNFALGNDFTTGREDELFYLTPGDGQLGYTFDREIPGTFNFRTISVQDVVINEGGQAEFILTLSEALNTDLIVSYFTESSGSAVDDIANPTAPDYIGVPLGLGTVTIPAGTTQVSVFIDTIDDGTFEGNETFRFFIDDAVVELTDFATGLTFFETFASAIDPYAIATIVDSDPIPQITISDAFGFEKGNGESGQMTFNVMLSNTSADPIFVDFSTQDATANVDVDYRFLTGTLTFAPGETMKTITVEILSDDVFNTPGFDQDLETLFVNLTTPKGAVIADAQGVGTILNARFVTISDAFANGDGDAPATSTARFAVTLTDSLGIPSPLPSGRSLTVNFSTQNGTALASTGDYVARTNQTLTFNEFESVKFIDVTVNQDRIFEGDERFTVNITSTNGTIQRGTATGTITENLEVVSSQDSTGQGLVQVYDVRTGISRITLTPYPGFLGEVRVATGDFNGDGIADIVTAPGPGGGPHIRVLDGTTGAPLRDFLAYDVGFTGGVFVALGDINNDGQDDIITGPDIGGGPHVKVFDGVTGLELESFLATTLGIGFTGGIRVAAGNVNGIPGDEVILGFGPGSEPLVQVYALDSNPTTVENPYLSFNAYAPGFSGGVFVAAADIGGGAMNALDGFADIITGAGAGGGPHVKVFAGTSMPVMMPTELESFLAYNAAFLGGVRVATGDVSNDLSGNAAKNRASEILTAPGRGGGPHVRAFSVDGNPATAPLLFQDRFPFPINTANGVFISGRTRNQIGEGSPLLLDDSAFTGTENAPALTEAELAPVVEAAFNRLSAVGVDQAALNQLRQIQFILTDLEGSTLGLQLPGRILIDRTAAGRGYFVDLTPDQDEEFDLVSNRLIANNDAAAGRVDLLTVILHELGHALGDEHETGLGHGSHLLAPTILPGERRLPEHDEVFAAGDLFDSLLDLN